ncbi:MAG: S1/P1 nuclease [Chitinophagaceae bacterium]|nr:S1/P1 nuclease [Chitinophagaceae bacterium]
MRLKYLFFCIIFVFSVETVSAWGVTGHRVVAEIAQRHLNSKARKELKKLIGEVPLAFWANWADFIKSDTSWRFAGKWHYVDLPAHMAKDDFIRDLKALPGENLYTQILTLQAQVKDENLPLDKKQTALKFLIHLVGDLHQPLHVGRDEDQGGNKIQVTWFGKPTNLHVIWDETLIDFQQWSYTEYATVLNVADKTQVEQWQNSSLEDWFYESHVVSDKIYDNTAPDSKLRYEYNYMFVQDLNNQLLKGGLRLAKILNEIFG